RNKTSWVAESDADFEDSYLALNAVSPVLTESSDVVEGARLLRELAIAVIHPNRHGLIEAPVISRLANHALARRGLISFGTVAVDYELTEGGPPRLEARHKGRRFFSLPLGQQVELHGGVGAVELF